MNCIYIHLHISDNDCNDDGIGRENNLAGGHLH